MCVLASLLAGLGLIASPLWASDEVGNLKKSVSETVGIQQRTQEMEDDWAGEKAGLETRYHQLKAKGDHLRKRVARLKEEVAHQQEQVAEYERKLVVSTEVREELSAELAATLNRLDAWVSEDLPFLPDERDNRLHALKEVMVSDVSMAEKLRRVMEALQIEMKYGNTVGTYQDTIEIDGTHVLVDVFRLGRLSQFYKTPDDGQVGHYDPVTRRWVRLPAKYRRVIDRAMEMANRRRPIEFVQIPIGRIEP